MAIRSYKYADGHKVVSATGHVPKSNAPPAPPPSPMPIKEKFMANGGEVKKPPPPPPTTTPPAPPPNPVSERKKYLDKKMEEAGA